jgi:hypothetical protein
MGDSWQLGDLVIGIADLFAELLVASGESTQSGPGGLGGVAELWPGGIRPLGRLLPSPPELREQLPHLPTAKIIISCDIRMPEVDR